MIKTVFTSSQFKDILTKHEGLQCLHIEKCKSYKNEDIYSVQFSDEPESETKRNPCYVPREFVCCKCNKKLSMDTLTYYKKNYAPIIDEGIWVGSGMVFNGIVALIQNEARNKIQTEATICYDCQIEVLEYALIEAKKKREVEK